MQLKQAQRTGHMRLCNSGLRTIPTNAFLIHEVRFGEDDQWWDRTPISRIDLTNNEIEEISTANFGQDGDGDEAKPAKRKHLQELWPEVNTFCAAQNKIASISPQLFQLENLTTLDLR